MSELSTTELQQQNVVHSAPADPMEHVIHQDCVNRVLVVFRWICLASGPLLTLFGIFSYTWSSILSLSSFLLSLYVTVFGALIFFGEFKWKRFLKAFPFLMTRPSRALFIIFCGTLCFGLKIGKLSWPGYVVGLWCMIVGLLYFFFSMMRMDQKEEIMKREFEQAHRQKPPPKQNDDEPLFQGEI
ncbi:putative COPI associated protein [Blattamonas nauphoetae]|uniref:COPI associated protein n=1 Tax=Blattamonas nauphoetae TaxID=2049346 RepID=A0ABQ9XYB9_9EUKA|nr:putative COPI associated protein [Blattamonas nauphoetae]